MPCVTVPAGPGSGRADAELLAARIAAAHARRDTLPAPVPGPDLGLAYEVQHLLLRRRLGRGERLAGWKLGYTSAVMRAQMGIDAPNLGPLTDAMVLRPAAGMPALVPTTVTQPKVEPEVAIVLGADVPPGADRDVVMGRVRSAHACLEVVDSVWTGYRFRLEDNTADGSSAAYAVIGPEVPLAEVADVRVELRRVTAGEVSTWGEGVGADAFGHPVDAVVWLSAALAERGERVRAGQVVLTGGLTAAAPLEPADEVRAVFRWAAGEAAVATRRGVRQP